MCTRDRALTIAAEVSAYAKEYLGEKLYAVIVYGSYARADFTEESDIDIFVLIRCSLQELDTYERDFCRVSSRLSLQNDVTVSVTLRDVDTFDRYKAVLPFYRNVEGEGIRIA
jgi:predicted nucleotidyltransferase